MASRTLAKFAFSSLRSRCRFLAATNPLLRFLPNDVDKYSRMFSTRPATSSLNDPSPNWSNRPPKETILLDGCDFEHWLVVVERPEPSLTRDEIIDSYIKTLTKVLGRKTLSTGRDMPVVGFGTVGVPTPSSETFRSAVLDAIRIGYRHFDTASLYGNEQRLGGALAEALSGGLVRSREELFVTTKLWIMDAHRGCVIPSLKESLREEEAKKSIYSVSTKNYFAFGALCPRSYHTKLKLQKTFVGFFRIPICT